MASSKSKKWYKGCFILVSTHQNGERSYDTEYRHPNLYIRRMYGGDGIEHEGLPVDLKNPTQNSNTELAFQFQSHVLKPDEGLTRGHEYLNVQKGKTFSACYGGKLESEIHVEQFGISYAAEQTFKRLKDVDRALKTWAEAIQNMGVTRSPCDLTTLMLALQNVWKLPLLFVCWTGHGDPLVLKGPLQLGVPTWSRLQNAEERRAFNVQ